MWQAMVKLLNNLALYVKCRAFSERYLQPEDVKRTIEIEIRKKLSPKPL
jgi:hypothetical protein